MHLPHSVSFSARCISNTSISTEFLVDADTHNLEQIDQAFSQLITDGKTVKGMVFAEPARLKNKKWNKFITERGFSFTGVQPNAPYDNPTDHFILDRMRALAGDRSVDRVCLLTSDIDFLSMSQELMGTGKEVIVFIPQGKRRTISRYKEGGVHVVILKPPVENMFTVKAFLHSDGNGSVQRCDPFGFTPVDKEAAELEATLEKSKFLVRSKNCKLVPCLAKLWFSNLSRSLESLTVYPASCAITEMHHAMAQERPDHIWEGSSDRLAFFCPHRSSHRPSKQEARKYGGKLAWTMARSPAPFILPDSTDLPLTVLSRLGYVDGGLNSDVHEAMLVFANMYKNKRYLREVGELPCSADSVPDISSKLRKVFTSSATEGQWQVAPSDANVRSLLVRERHLNCVTVDQGEVFHAMQRYASLHALPQMKTYNGYVWQILLHANAADPLRRGSVT